MWNIAIVSLKYISVHFGEPGLHSFHYFGYGIQAKVITKRQPVISKRMMTSSNGNIFRVTGPLCGEFTGPGEVPTQRPVTRSFDVFFDLRLNKRLSKQPWGWWFETPSWSLWRQCNGLASRRSLCKYNFHGTISTHCQLQMPSFSTESCLVIWLWYIDRNMVSWGYTEIALIQPDATYITLCHMR